MREEIEELLEKYFVISPINGADKASRIEFAKEIDKLYTPEGELTLDERRKNFHKSLEPYLEKYGSKMLNNFSSHWLERSPRGRKFKFETKDTFNVRGRLVTWAKNQEKYSIVNMLKKQGNYER